MKRLVSVDISGDLAGKSAESVVILTGTPEKKFPRMEFLLTIQNAGGYIRSHWKRYHPARLLWIIWG